MKNPLQPLTITRGLLLLSGLGNRCSIQLSYGGSQCFQSLSLVGWLVSFTTCSRLVALKICVKGFCRLSQVFLRSVLRIFAPNYFYLFRGKRLDGPVPIFLGQQPHQGDGVLDGSIQIVTRHVSFYKTGNCTILLG